MAARLGQPDLSKWFPHAQRLNIKGLRGKLASSSNDPAAIDKAQDDEHESETEWAREQRIHENTRQWVEQQIQFIFYYISVDSVFQLDEDPQDVLQTTYQPISPQLSQEEKDAEERARPENEVDSQFGSDDGLGNYFSKGLKSSQNSPTDVPGVRNTTFSTKEDINNHERLNRFRRAFSSRDTSATAVASAASSTRSDDDAPSSDVIQSSTKSPAPSAADSSSPPPVLRRRYRGWVCMCNGCYFQREVDAVSAAQAKLARREVRLERTRQRLKQLRHQREEEFEERHRWQEPGRPSREVVAWERSRRSFIAALVGLVIYIGGRAMRTTRSGVASPEVEDYIWAMYVCHCIVAALGVYNDDDTSSTEDQARPDTWTRICLPLKALPTAVPVILSYVAWAFIPMINLFEPARLLGICTIIVSITVGYGLCHYFDTSRSSSETTTRSSISEPAEDEDKQSACELHTSCSRHRRGRSRARRCGDITATIQQRLLRTRQRDHEHNQQRRMLFLKSRRSRQQQPQPERLRHPIRVNHSRIPGLAHHDLVDVECPRFRTGSCASSTDCIGGHPRGGKNYAAFMIDLYEQYNDGEITWDELRSMA